MPTVYAPALGSQPSHTENTRIKSSESQNSGIQLVTVPIPQGLAAPQIGKSIALVVIDGQPLAERFPECEGFKRTIINPELEILDGDEVGRDEGCLSLPGLSEEVKRVEHIRLRYLDGDLQPREEEISGFAARIVQHELDHLMGKVYTDRVNLMRRQLIKGKLNNIATGRTTPEYPFRTAAPRRKR